MTPAEEPEPHRDGQRSGAGGPGLRDLVALALGLALFGVAYGVAASSYGIALPVAASALVLGGGSQVAALGVLDAGGSTAAAVAAGGLLNLRFVALGLAVGPWLGRSPLRRSAASHLVGDHACGLALAAPPAARRRTFLLAGLTVWVVWTAATALGAAAGSGIDPAVLGADAAIAAGFVALVRPHLAHDRGRAAAGVGAVVALVALPLAGVGLAVLAGSVAGVTAGARVGGGAR